jgi:hypothetical protein
VAVRFHVKITLAFAVAAGAAAEKTVKKGALPE